MLCFVLSAFLINLSLQRNAIKQTITNKIINFQEALNEFGYDIAYDKIQTSSLYPQAILSVENLQIYPLTSADSFSLKIPHFELQSSFWQPQNFEVKTSPQQVVVWNNQFYDYNIGPSSLSFSLSEKGNFAKINLNLSDIDIKNFAKIKIITYSGIAINPQLNLGNKSTFENQLDLQDLSFNGLLNYPLSQNINRFYVKANLSGEIKKNSNFRRAVNDWLEASGTIDINDFVINWSPFALVGRGELSFNEEIKPRLHMETSSKALLNFIDDLDGRGWLESKGVFVAKVLLNSKAYPLKEGDKYLTVTTPIDYRDNRLAIEKITVKNF